MTTPVLNVTLLDATLAEVRRAARRPRWTSRRGSWYQREWRVPYTCGTAFCFGGWALELDGAEWVGTSHPSAPNFLVFATRGERGGREWDPIDGRRVVHASVAARHRLGLTARQADTLFGAWNRLPDLTRIVALIKAGELR